MRVDLFGQLAVDIDDNRFILLAPTFRDGRHLTFYLRPQRSGRHAGLLTPHTTIGRVHRTLARLRPDRLRAFADRVGRDLVANFRERTRSVMPAELEEEGWAVIFPLDDEERKGLFDPLRTDRGSRVEFPLDEAAMERVGKALLERAVSPLSLDDPDFPRDEQGFATRVNDRDEPETCGLTFRPDDLRGPPGWYATPVPFVSPKSFERLVEKYC